VSTDDFSQMQKLSTPLLFLSVTSTLGDLSSKQDDESSSTTGAPDLPAESQEATSTSDTRLVKT
jgi:hypothetical protein